MKQFLIRLAKDAGKILVKGYNSKKKITSKGNLGIVTDVDHKSERFIVGKIKKKFPSYSILTEETLSKKTKSDWLWIIDPIDGTTNFSQKLPMFCVSIALAYKNQLRYGVVYAPILDELFYAEKGKGAYLNNKKIRVSTKSNLKDSVLVTGFAYDRGKIMWNNLKNIGNILDNRKTHGVRIDGSAALDLCYVAAGRYDGFWEFNLAPWDMAAGALIVMEAKGKVTRLDKKPWGVFDRKIIVTNGRLHNKILEIVR